MKRTSTLTAAAALLYLLIIVSGVVRITGSEPACPGWPLCGGSPAALAGLPWNAWLELAHRLLTLLAGVSIIVAAQATWQQRTHLAADPWQWRPPLLAALLLPLHALASAAVLLAHQPWLFVVLTVALQTLLLALLLLPLVAQRVEDLSHIPPASADEARHTRTYRWLVVGTLALSWVLVIIGATVAGTASGMACVGFPDCNGELFPTSGGLAVFIHMTHRIVAYLLVLLMLWVFGVTAVRRWRDYVLLQWVLLAGGLLMTQATIGGAQSLLAMPLFLRALHLAMATTYWASMVLLTMLVLRRPVLSGLDSSGRILRRSVAPPASEPLTTETQRHGVHHTAENAEGHRE